MDQGLMLPYFLVHLFHIPQWEWRKKGFGEEKIKEQKRNVIVKPQQLARSQAVNPKASFCMCTFKLAACLDPFFHLNRM